MIEVPQSRQAPPRPMDDDGLPGEPLSLAR